jgi:two-component system cell cycle sensor histidine kinase/response regulator CckA
MADQGDGSFPAVPTVQGMASQDALRRFELISEYTRDIILFLRRDGGGILDVNAAAVGAYGYTREELLSMSVLDLRAHNTLPLVQSEMERADSETILFETTHRRKDGTTFPVEVSSRGATVGGVRTLISIVRDITERVQARAAMESAALFPFESPSPVLRIAADGAVVFANPASQPVLDEWKIELGSRVPAPILDAIQSATAENERREIEMTCAGRELSLMVAPVSATGYVNIYGYDVTGRKQAERTLNRAMARQEMLARVVSRLLESEDPQGVVEDLAHQVMRELECDLFFNYLVDPESSRLRLNAWAGVPAETALRIKWLDFGSAVCGCVARDQTRIVAECIPETPDPRTRLVASFGALAYACHPLMAGGRLLGTLSFGSRRKRRFSDDDLDVMRSVTNHIAIAMERIQARNLLSESEQRYRTIARSIPHGGVWVVDQELRFRLVEGVLPDLLDMGAGRLVGRTVRDILTEPLAEPVEQRYRRALAGERVSYEATVAGRTLWSQYVPLRDEEGRITRAMSLTLDISERRRLEERLRDSQKMESVAILAGGIAHDFNNLLVGIIGNISLALEICEGSRTLVPFLEDALRAGEQAAHLTREMLAYSGRGKFVVETVNLSELVVAVRSLVRSSIPHVVTFEFDCDPSMPPILADATQVQQIVMNLVINAAEAIGNRPGSIVVRTRPTVLDSQEIAASWSDFDLTPGPYVWLQVVDSGAGMDAATKSRIFDPFFTTKFTGRGLGLAAVLGIVRGHKGAIRVESEPGRGSVFTLIFPAADASALRESPRAGTASAVSGPRAILVVDDEEIVTHTAEAALHRRGYDVRVAESGSAAIDLLRSNASIELIILDLSMPGMSGQEALVHIHTLRPGLPVIISSGYSESECREVFRNDRISGFLQKPYTAQRLREAVEAALSHHTAPAWGGL